MGFNDRISSYSVDAGRRGYNRNGNGVARGTRWNYREAESVVRQSYRSVLGRDPDPSGLSSWTDQVVRNNWTQRDLENALRQSDEYRALRNNGNGNGEPRRNRRR